MIRVQSMVLMVLVAAGCPTKRDNRTSDEPVGGDDKAADEGAAAAAEEPPDDDAEAAHHVVFADRTSQGYLLLIEGDKPEVPSRAALADLVRSKLGADEDEPEVGLLLQLVDMEPKTAEQTLEERSGATPTPDGAPPDLLGLHIDVLPVQSTEGDLVPPELFADPVLTRELDPKQRASLARRRWAILLRADYRNQFALRGLRLLQTLVRVVAAEKDALVHDPDTGETMDLEAFAQRRLKSSLDNVADQVAVVPFPDPKHGEQYIRLSTRGMRRFGSVDLELDGLPRDPALLQKATHLIYGLAHQMARQGELSEGYAAALPSVVTIDHDDVVAAYPRGSGDVPRCSECPQQVDVHLVERPTQPHDPRDHVVARIVAPRERSDATDYDQPAWAKHAVEQLFGP